MSRLSWKLSRRLTRYWGYIALALALVGWIMHLFTAAVILALSLGALFYVLLQAPVTCGARNRDGTFCRNNSHGILLGCNQVRQHKWQHVRMTFMPNEWRIINRTLWTGAREVGNTLSGLAAVVTAIAAVIALK